MLSSFEDRLLTFKEELENSRTQLSNAKEQVNKPFPQEDELKTKSARMDELNIMLNMDKTENAIVVDEPDESIQLPEKLLNDLER